MPQLWLFSSLSFLGLKTRTSMWERKEWKKVRCHFSHENSHTYTHHPLRSSHVYSRIWKQLHPVSYVCSRLHRKYWVLAQFADLPSWPQSRTGGHHFVMFPTCARRHHQNRKIMQFQLYWAILYISVEYSTVLLFHIELRIWFMQLYFVQCSMFTAAIKDSCI